MLLGPFGSGQRADYRQMIEVNLLGAITATEVFLDQLKDGGGDIINISSVAGRTARSGNGVYAATKWGINGWSESLRQELLPDVRVTLVEPGVVATELPNHITHPDTKQGVQQLYDKAEVTAEDVAEIIAFILSRPRRLAINEILCGQQGNSDAPQLVDGPSGVGTVDSQSSTSDRQSFSTGSPSCSSASPRTRPSTPWLAGTFRQHTDLPKAARDLLTALNIDLPRNIHELTTPCTA